MKKLYAFFSLAVLLLGLVVFTLPAIDTSPSDPGGGTGGSGGGTVTTWIRNDVWCTPKHVKEKTYCTIGGDQQCTAQYCR